MSKEEIRRRSRQYLGSYFGLLMGWIGLAVIGAGVVLGLRLLEVFHASRALLVHWGWLALGSSAIVYGLVMIILTWSFTRSLHIHFLPGAAFSIWGAIPVCNAVPLVILLLLAAKREPEPPLVEKKEREQEEEEEEEKGKEEEELPKTEAQSDNPAVREGQSAGA